ncbi:Methyltransferase type 11 [Carbonactinospora thermoautotrophica]|uniref:Methyltransferase type 11 n=2 Tax=Carbonactinospora thermoautotrophica TaxID=1469144 RepID=A0A132MSH2_9ACTN|nr:methyltransferase domain-containing protein [Carbonactinospora thermoautotrophica]KWX00759.1 Methyltransferase type 11 [Carbonactinospora thermoautotrophica]
MSEPDEAIHQRLSQLLRLPAAGRLVDLGCGAGPTLAAVSRDHPDAHLIGVDRSLAALRHARQHLGGHPGPVGLVAADLRAPLPLADASVDAVVSYNTLECLPDPPAVLREVARVLRPGGRAVLAHTDFDSLLIAGPEPELDRRVCHAFTDQAQAWMDHADGRIGRKLPGLVVASPLIRDTVEPWVVCATALAGHAARRIDDICRALLAAAATGQGTVSAREVTAWHAAVRKAAARGEFFFAETAVIVTAHRPLQPASPPGDRATEAMPE